MLWLLELSDPLQTEEICRLLPALTEPRQRRVKAMKNPQLQTQVILAELLLRYALKEEHNLSTLPPIERTKQGKPFFPSLSDLHFNLSHCKTAVACVLDTAPAGVDVQEYRQLCRPSGTLYRNVLTKSERSWVEAGETFEEQIRRFTALWTCKEAYGKALGVGLCYDLNTTQLLPQGFPWVYGGFTLEARQTDSYAAALCAKTPLPWRQLTIAELLYPENGGNNHV